MAKRPPPSDPKQFSVTVILSITPKLNIPTRSKPKLLQKPQPTHQPKPYMASRVHLIFPKIPSQPIKFQNHPFPSITQFTLISNTSKTHISCTNSNISDAKIASDLATEVEKMNTHLVQREEAMKKSRELLFTELCLYLAMRAEEVKKKWRKMGEEEKWVLAKGFVAEWGINFHPLSARSVKELVEEHLDGEVPSSDSSPSLLIPGLRGIMGHSPNK